MVDVYVDLKQIATGLDKNDLIKVIAAWYAEHVYGVEDEEDDLANVANYIAEDDDILLSIENTLANLDRQFDEEDYEDDDYDENYDNEDYDDDEEDDTQRLIEANRRKNEAYLGL